MPVTITESITTVAGTLTTSTTLSPADEGLTYAPAVIVANGQTDKLVSIGGVDISQLVAVYIKSTAAVTIETNSDDATGGDTLVLVANIPYLWYTGKEDDNVLTEDIATSVYVTNASGSSATVSFVFVQDSTP